MNQQTTQKEPTEADFSLADVFSIPMPVNEMAHRIAQHVAACVARETDTLASILRNALDRDAGNETLQQLVVLAANGIGWRDRKQVQLRTEVSRLREALQLSRDAWHAMIKHEPAVVARAVSHALDDAEMAQIDAALSPAPAEVNLPSATIRSLSYEAWKAQQDAEEAEKRRLDASLKASPPLAPRADEGTPTPRTRPDPLIIEALSDWSAGKLTAGQCCSVITLIVSTVDPTPEDIAWAKALAGRKEEEKT